MDPDDKNLDLLLDNIEDLVMKIDSKIEEKKKLIQKQSQLPRGKIMTWSGELENYIDFKKSMQEFLCYELEGLNLSTLMSQIVGKDKHLILDYLYNVESLE